MGCLTSPTISTAADDGKSGSDDIATLDYPSQQGVKGEAFSFARSKYALAKDVYVDHPIDFYAGCRYETKEKLLVPVWASCGFKPRKSPDRAHRIEWEHVVPAWVFGHQLQCWQDGGRTNCRNTHAKFREMEADMHNLVPAIGEINGDRSNFPYGMIEGEPRVYGKPNMEIDFAARRAEPAEQVWGDIARSTFYMRDRYGLKLSKSDESLLQVWNKLDPVDAWEKLRNTRIANIQGNDNPYVSHYSASASTTPKQLPVPDAPADSTPSMPLPEPSGDWLAQLYAWVEANQSNIPYPLVVVAMAVYWWFRQRNNPSKSASTRTKSTAKTTRKSTKG